MRSSYQLVATNLPARPSAATKRLKGKKFVGRKWKVSPSRILIDETVVDLVVFVKAKFQD